MLTQFSSRQKPNYGEIGFQYFSVILEMVPHATMQELVCHSLAGGGGV